jgi:hypothetical protein
LIEAPTPVLLLLGASACAAVWVDVLVWRRSDHVLFKMAVTLVTLIPVLGPIVGLWVTSFPDKMHPDLQAKYKNTVNVYSVPKDFIRSQVEGQSTDEKA